MNYSDEKQMLKRLMRDALTPGEMMELNTRENVQREMLDQWDTAPDASQSTDGTRLWNRIYRRITGRGREGLRFYRIYSAVASILLLIAIGGTVFMALEGDKASMYVVSTGIRSMQSVTLPDGTEVQLGPNSRMTYPSKFGSRKRVVQLEGQAFFDVNKNPRKPFIVHSSDMDIQVLGTAFEVFNYEIETQAEVILLSGKVNVTSPADGKRKECVLRPNQRLQYDKRTNTLSMQTLDADKYTAWRMQGILSFENEKLSMIIPRLEQWYGRKAICPRDLADKYRFTFKVRDESLERILYMMKKSSPLTYKEIEEGNYEIMLK